MAARKFASIQAYAERHVNNNETTWLFATATDGTSWVSRVEYVKDGPRTIGMNADRWIRIRDLPEDGAAGAGQ